MGNGLLYKFIIYSKEDHAILVIADKNGISLPSYKPIISHVAVTNHINRYLEKEYNIKTNVLKCFSQKGEQRVYIIELLRRDTLVSSKTRWLQITDINQFDGFSRWENEILQEWLSPSNETLFPWFMIGWRNKMEMWLENIIPDESISIEQVRNWERSALFKVDTARKSYYFKAVPNIFSHEPSISLFLFQNHPSDVPEIINIEVEKKWYVMKAIRGPLLGRTKKMEYWKQSILRLADIQKHSALHRNELEKLKCPIRPIPNILQDYLDGSLQQLANKNEISSETYNKLITSAPIILEKSRSLISTKVPLSLDHGDFFGGNIIVQNGKPIIYDWSDCSLSHPFLSIVVFLEEVEHLFSQKISLTLLDEYLNKWTVFNSKEKLVQEFELVKLIAPAYYLTVYQTFIFPSFHDNWDKQQIIDGYVNEWIKALDSM
ncbi:phosphotransferase [Alkalihalobacterium chitinilyticum]|uniref:Aminoglycoside phosphotransferase family protein n=1 Tax=Alkalihalobacterium chitinilyticum TaxID=2980103 RepID=A0ABT5VF46_9BACI|nr:phosphotransferase [Alkalihalobacterium chitinilyticum]MDE5413307.1 aminoglycoside phosphotransferase family protein [Alkalihalobacterium chitinilyticum]